MATDRLKKEFDAKAKAKGMTGVSAYHALLKKLATGGKGFGKTVNVGAYLLPDIQVQTNTRTGLKEMSKAVSVEKLYVTIDLEQYPLEEQRQMIIREIGRNWAGKTIRERDLQLPDFEGPGVWTLKKSNFEFDYVKASNDPASSEYKPNPDAYRVCVTVSAPARMPCVYPEGFQLEAGATVAIRERDMAALCHALQEIQQGKKTPAEALLTTDKDGNLVAKFDVYGMEPGFLGKNYNPVKLKDASVEEMARTKAGEKTAQTVKLKK